MSRRQILLGILLAAGALLCVAFIKKLTVSEQLRIAWNRPRFFYDGRHKLDADSRAVIFDLAGELWVRDRATTQYIRIIPRAGLDLCGEQNVSFVSDRDGQRAMLKLRPQWTVDAADDYSGAPWEFVTNVYQLYFEQRRYSNDVLMAHYKDAAYGPGGLFFVDPATGEHIARSNYSTVYVPTPDSAAHAGPPEWLWAAAANRAFVEEAITGRIAQAAWDGRYLRQIGRAHV